MIKVSILKSDVVTNSAVFENQGLADAWIAQEEANNSWGEPSSYTVEQEDLGNAPKMENIRAARNQKLAACDWTQLADSPLSSENKAEWASYRQALRDLPNQEGFNPDSFSWPEQP